MSMWENFVAWANSGKNKFKNPVFEPSAVDQAYDAQEIEENTSYCRLWLQRMRLAQNVEWFQGRYPVVYAAAAYQYGNDSVTVPHIAGGVDFFKQLTEDNLDRVLTKSVPLSPLFPYRSGLVTLQAGLFSMKASDPINASLKAMGRFSEKLPVPSLSTVLNIIDPLYSGIEDLFNVGESHLELGFQQTFAPAGNNADNTLRPGYFAVIYDPADQLLEEDLRVVKGDIHQPAGQGKTELLTGFSYMLFRVEKRASQDWENLTAIKEMVERAQDAILAKDQQHVKDIIAAIKVAIFRSKDVVRGNQEEMMRLIEAYLKKSGLQAKPGEVVKLSLNAIMQTEAPEVSAEVLAGWQRLERLLNPPAH